MDAFGEQNLTVKREIEDLVTELVRYRTVKGNREQKESCFEFIENYFDGFDVQRFEKDGDLSIVVSCDGGRKPEVLLHSHIDVVEAPLEQFVPKTRDGKIYGRGAADMKAGVACLMKGMKDVSIQKDAASTALMLTSDEERGGFNGAGYLFNEIGYSPGFGISAEANREDGFLDVTVQQKGVLQLKVATEGEAGHGSSVESLENAAVKLLDAYSRIEELFAEAGDTTLNLSSIEAGDAVNKVPGSAEMALDIRYTPDYPGDEVLEDIRQVPGVEVDVIAQAPMLENDRENRYIKELKGSLREVCGSGELISKNSASDMRFLTSKGIPAVVFGPEGYDIHGDSEHAVTDSFKPYYDVLMSFCRGL